MEEKKNYKQERKVKLFSILGVSLSFNNFLFSTGTNKSVL